MRDTDTCPRCGHSPAVNRCWECGWTPDDDDAPKGRAPSPAVPDTRNETQIQAGIVDTLSTLGWSVYDLSQPRNTMQTPGLADLYVAGHGVTGWLEVKTPNGVQSAAQSLFEQTVRRNGGHYTVVRSEEEAAQWAENARRGAS